MSVSRKKTLSNDDIGILFLIAALAFGAWFRFYIPSSAGFPINDGGLFYKMIEALQVNQYRLPEFVNYNGLEIPYAYPPLAFYLAGGIADLLDISLFVILSWFPAIFLIATIPVVYYAGIIFLESRYYAGLSALLYAVLPASLTWLIMGGGITRSLGQFFLLLAVTKIYRAFTEQKRKHALLATLFSSLVCLTHPEAALHTLALAFLLWAFYGRTKEGIFTAFLIALGTLTLTSPWWITTLLRFGLDPYLSAAQTGLHKLSYLVVLFAPFSGEPFLTIIAVLAVLGTVARIAKRKFLIPAWYILLFLVEPRSAVNVAIVPMTFLASIALLELILPTLASIEGKNRNATFPIILQSASEKILFYYLLGCLLIGMQYYVITISENRLSVGGRDTFDWVRQNTPPSAKFLLLTGEADLFADFANEWFPVLAERTSATTIQGYEWVGGQSFSENVTAFQGIQLCVNESQAMPCIEGITSEAEIQFEYIIVAQTTEYASITSKLILELKHIETYELLYETGTVAVFRTQN